MCMLATVFRCCTNTTFRYLGRRKRYTRYFVTAPLYINTIPNGREQIQDNYQYGNNSLHKCKVRHNIHSYFLMYETLCVLFIMPLPNIWLLYNDKYSKDNINIKLDLYKSWLKDAPQGKLVTTDKANHSIHLDQPKLVIDCILSIVNQIRSN
jgi:hypothetical protein